MSRSQTTRDEPLGLTVHAMSVPDSGLRDASSHTASGRWKMIMVLLVCAAPVLLSYFTYYVIRPEGRRNYGELVNPQRPLPALATQTLDGRAGQLTALQGQWLLISIAGAACDSACEQRLYFQRQLRESLGREKERLDRVWLVNDGAVPDSRLGPALATSTVLRVHADALAQWLAPAAGQRTEDHLYLVDPLGNLMMRFPANMDAAGAAKQWEHALRKTEPGSEMASRLRGGIDEARQRAGLPALPALAAAPAAAPGVAAAAQPAAAASATGGTVQVRISLAPALAAKAAPDDTLFIFARAVQGQGPKAPLAIQRRQVKDLPLTLTLDDSMAMSPALRLSSVSQVVVGARISKSGNAMPQPGDLQGLTPTVAVGASGLQLQINETLP